MLFRDETRWLGKLAKTTMPPKLSSDYLLQVGTLWQKRPGQHHDHCWASSSEAGYLVHTLDRIRHTLPQVGPISCCVPQTGTFHGTKG